MRLLFDMDRKDYDQCTHQYMRNSSRAIIIRDNKLAMVHSLKYNYFKFPGGGIEEGETAIEALIRETMEETGLIIDVNSIKEYGYVHRIQRNDVDESECFVQNNYYFFCDVEGVVCKTNLDEYEAAEHFTLEYVSPYRIVDTNRNVGETPHDLLIYEREAKVAELLVKDGILTRDIE